jgi:excisionase family DNA binding protein
MELTPGDLWTLRNIALRTVKDVHEVFAAAARRQRQEAKADRRDRCSRRSLAEEIAPPPLPPRPAPADKLTYTLKEACVALGLGKSTLYKLIGDGRLPTIRVGGRRLIETRALEGFLAAARSGPLTDG